MQCALFVLMSISAASRGLAFGPPMIRPKLVMSFLPKILFKTLRKFYQLGKVIARELSCSLQNLLRSSIFESSITLNLGWVPPQAPLGELMNFSKATTSLDWLWDSGKTKEIFFSIEGVADMLSCSLKTCSKFHDFTLILPSILGLGFTLDPLESLLCFLKHPRQNWKC